MERLKAGTIEVEVPTFKPRPLPPKEQLENMVGQFLGKYAEMSVVGQVGDQFGWLQRQPDGSKPDGNFDEEQARVYFEKQRSSLQSILQQLGQGESVKEIDAKAMGNYNRATQKVGPR